MFKKGQISIEVLTILSILVVGGVIFGVYYLNGVNKEMADASKLKLTPEESDSPSMQPGNEIPTDSIQPPYTPGEFIIALSLDPDGASLTDTDFDIIVTLNGVSDMDGDINVTEINVKNKDLDSPSSDCNYNGTPINGTLSNLDILIGNNSGEYINLPFSCSTDGNYTFTISANGIDDDGNFVSPPSDYIDKEITSTLPAEISLNLFLDPDETTPQGSAGMHKFGVRADANFTEDENIYIKQILVSEFDEPSNKCYYDLAQIPDTETGLTLNSPLLMNKNGNDYNLILPDFSCTELGEYKIILVAGLGSDSSRDVNNYVVKTINGLNVLLSLQPDGASAKNAPFGIFAHTEGYNSDKNISIRHIYVSDSNGNSLNYCSYNGNEIRDNNIGLSVDLKLNKYGGDYNLLLSNNFSCSQSGTYIFKFVTHDDSEYYPSPLYDFNSAIDKVISENSDCLFNDPAHTGQAGDLLNPYFVYNAEDLYCIRYHLSKHFKLGNDINLNHTLLSNNSDYNWYNDVNGWPIIGTFNTRFTGSLNGNNYTIYNLYSKSGNTPGESEKYYAGLFLAAEHATFKDFNLTNVDVNGNGGSLVAKIWDVNIENIHVTGVFTGKNFSGGIVGEAKAYNMTNCSFTGNITGMASGVGGLVGSSSSWYDNTHYFANITDSHFSGNFLASSISGGIVGQAMGYTDINNCYADINMAGRVPNIGGDLGGLVGIGGIIINSHADVNISGIGNLGGLTNGSGGSIIINSYATGNITALPNTRPGYGYSAGIGGLSGWPAKIYNSYSSVNITVLSNGLDIGGLNGIAFSDINNSYSRGNITITGYGKRIGGLLGSSTYSDSGLGINNNYSTGQINISGTKTNIGGLIGLRQRNRYAQSPYVLPTVSNSYWDINTSGQATSAGGEGRTTDDMTHPDYPNTYTGWDFYNLWEDDSYYSQNSGYPYLRDPDTRGGTCQLQLGSSSKQIVCDDGLQIDITEPVSEITRLEKEYEIPTVDLSQKSLIYR